MENVAELQTLITQLNETLAVVLQKLDEHEAKLSELDSVLYDGIVGPANDQIAAQEYNQALSDFRCKFAEKLDPYANAVKAIEGVDVYQKAFDTYNDGSYEISPDEYVEKLAESLKEQVASIKEVLNAEVELKVEGETPSGEDVEITTDGNDVEVDSESTEIKEEKDEKEAEESTAEAEEEVETLEDFEKSLREELDKTKGPLIRQ